MDDVRLAGRADIGQAARSLAVGFGDDPVLGWVFEEPGRAGKLWPFFDFLAEEALVPLGATYLLPGSCASWTPPGSPPWPDERGARFIAALAPSCTAGDLERLGVLDDAMRALHPEAPHWYLGLLATEPPLRGRGAGAALLRHSLERVDADHLPAYLKSTNPRNVPLYERHGFEVMGTIDLPGGPSLTPMWRTPR
ncbi:MAG: GNAT family N-acetyltransferase [Actinomycetota bacterium]|nr:GNAT family N-acetyltransferase [Actinomycetota bacterium]